MTVKACLIAKAFLRTFVSLQLDAAEEKGKFPFDSWSEISDIFWNINDWLPNVFFSSGSWLLVQISSLISHIPAT